MTKSLCSLAPPTTPWRCCNNADAIPAKASSLSLPSAALVGRFGQGGNKNDIDPRGNDYDDTTISLEIGWGGQ